jgi:prepilin-type N-terminal cleavage/methylation domain-containing protein
MLREEMMVVSGEFPCADDVFREGAKNCTRGGCAPRAFSLIEILVAITLLSLIVVALMAVFNSTQTAFRASITQTDVLEGGRATMDMMTADLRQMAPSFGQSNILANNYAGAVNFYASTNFYYNTQPLIQLLLASPSNRQRTNVLEDFFILSRGNLNGSPAWFGTGYAVNPAATNDLYPLYRFYMTTNVAAADPVTLFTNFMSSLTANTYTNSNWSHLLDGVVALTVRAYDTNGVWMTNGYAFGYTNSAKNVLFLPPALGEVGFYMFSNALPASVEIQLGVLEDRTLQRAATWLNGSQLQTDYLKQQAGKVHIFRQRVTIPNVDPSAYQ